jgi:RpiB/LacA/LacB family sugar-phosphate isomerase
VRIFIGADHRGYDLKKKITGILQKQGHDVVDSGTHVEGVDCDYPQISKDVAVQVVKHPESRGILVCMTGIGHSIAANKIPGAYAALVYNKEAAALSRQHNNSNILVLGSKFVDEPTMLEIINIWLTTAFEGGRHLRRKEQIQKIEQEFQK